MRIGNLAGIILPRVVLDDLGIKVGQQLDLRVKGGKLLVTPIRNNLRQGWAEAAVALRHCDDDLSVWRD